MCGIEAELDRGVDILTARAIGANEDLFSAALAPTGPVVLREEPKVC